MALAAGTKLGFYEVLAQIGAGATSSTKCGARFQSTNNRNRA
jgi:hypothetical protein